ncbi:MAG TPA: phosphoribosylglycinamide formyltransferase, partial [Bacilli bacterium]|nr:phosphoribosylglycinamide formyltransferase [Bacilli bacterium]
MKKIAVFASGNGSNFQAILDAVEQKTLDVEVALLVCDKPGAKAEERAKQHNVEIFSFSAKDYDSKEAFETEILSQSKCNKFDT